MSEVATARFIEFNINERLLRAIDEMGFEEPSPIQVQAIPPVMAGRDLIGQAQTGTGKTAAFGIPILQDLIQQTGPPRALILTPTRELAIQVAEEIARIGRYTPVRVLPIYGGQPIGRQIRAIHSGVDVVIGTPGRLLDHIRRKTLQLDNVRTVVLDEADEMLDMGFIKDIESILQETPSDRQTLLFSATMPSSIIRLANNYMRNPIRIAIQPRQITAPDIEQVYYEVRPHQRFDVLCRILDSEVTDRTIVFCRTKRRVDDLHDKLRARGYMVEALHGDMEQPQRNRVMQSFRSGDSELLIATDVAARGIDVEHITHVINYDMPGDPEWYVHRIGRTGRAGRTGTAITLIEPKEQRILRGIERVVNVRIKRRSVPTMADVVERRRAMWRDRLAVVLQENNLSAFRGIVEELAEEFDSIDVGAAALKLLIEQDRAQAVEEASQPRQAQFGDTGAESGMVRFFLNVGRNQSIGPAEIVRGIAEGAGIPGGVIGKIDIYENFTFVEVPQDSAEVVLNAMRNGRIHGRTVNVEPARPPGR
ncbi:MAG: DEAD/DEAH box helicase [Thermaerobacterales bacterium]